MLDLSLPMPVHHAPVVTCTAFDRYNRAPLAILHLAERGNRDADLARRVQLRPKLRVDIDRRSIGTAGEASDHTGAAPMRKDRLRPNVPVVARRDDVGIGRRTACEHTDTQRDGDDDRQNNQKSHGALPARRHIGTFEGTRQAAHARRVGCSIEGRRRAGAMQDWLAFSAVLSFLIVAGYTLAGLVLPELPR